MIGNQSGQVWYVADNGKAIELVYKGYDKSSDSLRYGFHPKYNNSKSYRLKRSVEPIIVTIVARSSAKFKRLYKERTSIERLNGRLDRDFRLENYTIRGLAKMKVVVTMSFLVMVGFALYKLNHGQTLHLASWVV
ncbi:transposase [Streptococcus sp. HF-1907]|uniref:transposase n=1 Tax=Streptococcus sp. HF-1907 TaxID=2785793 RepID=UPI001E289183|nr:transposase [Streptococcus sp. HF-1907]